MTGRKIYRRVVMDMNQEGFPIKEEDSYLYNGILALCAGEDDPGSDDDPDDDPDDGGGGDKGPDLKALQSELKEIKEGMKGNSEAVKEVNEYIKQLQEYSKQGPEDKKKSSGDDDPPSNLEYMDRHQYMDYIIGRVKSIIEDQVKPVGEKVQNVEENTYKERLQKEYNEVRSANKDFDEWKPEMKSLFQQNPYLTIQQAYTLAKHSNPDKAKKLEKKYAEKEDEEAKDKKFGGLTPTQKATKKAKGKNVKGEEAAELAWQTVMGDTDDIK